MLHQGKPHWIGSTGLSPAIGVTDGDWLHLSTIEPESEFRPKYCKIALKDAVKLMFLKRIFKFMINAAPPASNSIYDREKWFKYNNFTQLFSK